MRTVILAKAIRLLIPLFLIFSIYILFRGHNHPGGGFIGGLIGSIGFIFHTMTYGAKSTRKVYLILPFYVLVSSDINSLKKSYRSIWGSLIYIFRLDPDKETISKRFFHLDPMYLIALGLSIAGLSGMVAVLNGMPFMSAYWSDFTLPILGKPGTPIMFDLGVYLLVIGVIIKITFIMSEE
ncbi:MAG: cation:proton antiporter [Hymenobacteraceae bacterium]|nr:cation:proton antiporter [Hymenobacteraceae bacterium]MDX5397610.1 cation:proton antiporter [Hymenobacteraceae bacterium]MDX5443864.1 cation:proton antiporter [Hymenobacteraceae bacterium]MDX5513690.1 cation:proton antiporter [Hymenobacteraceae bacterium]